MWITLDYIGWTWSTLDYLNYSNLLGLLCFTLDFYELLRITSDYFDLLWLLRFTSDYSGLFRITPDYIGLPVQITKWSSGLPKLFPPRNYCRLRRITAIYFDCYDLLRISTIYFELLRITPEYSDYLNFLGLLRFTPDYYDSFRITTIHPGLLRITSH